MRWMGTAKLVKRLKGTWTGDARLYSVDPPMKYSSDYGKTEDLTPFVVVSATVGYSGPETYIFPSAEDGTPINWSELDGSFRGATDHEAALRNAGYEVQP